MFKCPVYAFGYDWRQPNAASADRLKERVDEILDEEQASSVVLVTHSMGGIVARAAMLDGVFRRKKVAGAVHIGQPVYGAPSAYRRFVEGIDKSLDGDLSKLIKGREQSRTVMSGIPSVFELLPNDATLDDGRRAQVHWLRSRTPDNLATLEALRSEFEAIVLYMLSTSPPGFASAELKESPARAVQADSQTWRQGDEVHEPAGCPKA